ncbi:MAG: hypothetical protein ABI158_02650, partial [Edaphobacter sp.]
MNKLICTLVTASVLTAGAAYGQAKHQTTNKTPQAISDTQMDNVTAGQTETSSSGGAIAADGSSVTTTNNSNVTLSGSALMGAKGVNVVSSADSSVANGVNVYDGSETPAGTPAASKVEQSNDVTQSNPTTSAMLTDYKRGANSQYSDTKSSDVTKSSTSASSINATLNHTATDSKSETETSAATHSSTYATTATKSAAENASASKSESGLDTSSASNSANKANAATD